MSNRPIRLIKKELADATREFAKCEARLAKTVAGSSEQCRARGILTMVAHAVRVLEDEAFGNWMPKSRTEPLEIHEEEKHE